MKKTFKLSKDIEQLLFSLLFIIIGILVVVFNRNLFYHFIEIVLSILLLLCVKDFVFLVRKKESKNGKLSRTIINFILLLVALNFMNISIIVVLSIFSTYFLINGVINLAMFVLLKINHIHSGMKELFIGLLLTTMGIIYLFAPQVHVTTLLIIVGVYLILFGLSMLLEYLAEVLDYPFRKIRITLPAIIDAFIPLFILRKINKAITHDYEEFETKKKNEKNSDLSILVHVSEEGTGVFGHTDIYFDNKVVSYGAYDKDNRIFHDTIGAGVVFYAPFDKYVKFCVKETNKTIFCFGLKLTENQKQHVRKELEGLKENLESWNPPILRDKRNGKRVNKKNYPDYPSTLYSYTKADFYKVKRGKYKVFFVLKNNCGSFVRNILKIVGTDVLKIYGIITPGTFYDYLEGEYLKKNSIVISKKIYTKDNIDTL